MVMKPTKAHRPPGCFCQHEEGRHRSTHHHGREHLVGITALKGLMLLILRYQDELRKPEPYFDTIETKVDDSAVKLAVDWLNRVGEVRT
jgi:hypothetical protein